MNKKMTLRTLTYHRGGICLKDTLEPIFLQINSKRIRDQEYLLLKCKKEKNKLAIMIDDEITVFERDKALELWKQIK